MSGPKGKVAILGGGMAGLSAAWRLSEPNWRDRFDSITVYQRGWRLGGKAASSRGPHGRIEEHGLHVWLGCYENAFGVLRECYHELDRATTDPDAPIHTWDKALIPADTIGLAEQWGDEWLVWLGRFTHNDESPGDPDRSGREMTVPGFLQQAVRLILDFADSLRGADPMGLVFSPSAQRKSRGQWVDSIRAGVLTALTAMWDRSSPSTAAELLDSVLAAVREALDYERRPDHKRSWLLISLVTATVRGMLADNLATHPQGFKAINDEDFTEWILRHGADPDVIDFPLVRGLYDFVFGHVDADHDRPAMGAGVAVFLIGAALFQYRGSIFWKMTAGMGDVVIAPLYQALRRRGVDFEFFHRLDALHLDDRHQAVDAITLGRQVKLAEGVDRYRPLTKVRGLPVFPDAPLLDQVEPRPGLDTLESHFGVRDDVEERVLRRGQDFDHVVLAVSVEMVSLTAKELIQRSTCVARHDHTHPHGRDAGTANLAAARRSGAWLGPARESRPVRMFRRSRLGHRWVRRCGPKIGRNTSGPARSRTCAAPSTHRGRPASRTRSTPVATSNKSAPMLSSTSMTTSASTFRALSPIGASHGTC